MLSSVAARAAELSVPEKSSLKRLEVLLKEV